MSRRYTKKEKAKILCELRASGESVSGYGRKAGIASSTLFRWVSEKDKIGRGDFIELSSQRHYELKVGAVEVRIPLTESANKISELVKALQC